MDGGTTTLTSPTMDASGGDVVLSYYRWFSNSTGPGPQTDAFTVEISDDDGGSWANLETVGPSGPGIHGGWFLKTFNLDDITGFTPNAQFRIRFTAEDVGLVSIVEAGVDGVGLSRLFCTDPCPDTDGDDVVGIADLLDVLGSWGACPGCAADFNCDGVVGIEDLLAVLGVWGPCPATSRFSTPYSSSLSRRRARTEKSSRVVAVEVGRVPGMRGLLQLRWCGGH